MSEREHNGGEGRRRTLAEWFTLALSSLVVLGVAASIRYRYLTGDERPPDFEVSPLIERARPADDRFFLRVRVRNTGGQTAEEVKVRVRSAGPDDADASYESAEFTILFIAAGGTAHGTVVLESDPRERGVEAAVVSYITP